uniref:Protein kinase domain-containing protein n=1 Tax=Panagrellus redivivus TaxID=6233 RepID=A0A7E4VDX8_PANRE
MQLLSNLWHRCTEIFRGRHATPSPEPPPGRLVLWIPYTANGRKKRIAEYLASLPYYFNTMLDDVDLQTQLLACPGEGFLIVCPRQENDRSNTSRKWLLVFLANNETIVKVNITTYKRKFVLAKERQTTLAQFIEEQEMRMIERPFFLSPDQITERMAITPSLPFPIYDGTFSLGILAQKTLNFDENRRIPCFELDCSLVDSTIQQEIYDEARRMLTFGNVRTWRLWGIVFEQPTTLKLILEDIVFGSLTEYVRLGHRLNSQLKRFALQMAEGLRYCEKFDFVHYRLSLDAFLITYSYNIKLALYGFSDGELVSSDEAFDDIDRCRWLAPENLPAPILPDQSPPADRIPYDLPSMSYTYGTAIWALFHGGAFPHEDEPPENIRDRAYRYDNLPGIDENLMPKDAIEVCHRCWNKKPSARPRFKELKYTWRKVQDSFHF